MGGQPIRVRVNLNVTRKMKAIWGTREVIDEVTPSISKREGAEGTRLPRPCAPTTPPPPPECRNGRMTHPIHIESDWVQYLAF